MVDMNMRLAIGLVCGVLRWNGTGQHDFIEDSSITVETDKGTGPLKKRDIFPGYVGSRSSVGSIIVNPSIRTPLYAEGQMLPKKVNETFLVSINVLSKSFAKGNQGQLVSICDTIQAIIDSRYDMTIDDWGSFVADSAAHAMALFEPSNKEILFVPQVWEKDGMRYVIDDSSSFDTDLEKVGKHLPGENYIYVASVDYNDEVAFGTHRGENAATLYVHLESNQNL